MKGILSDNARRSLTAALLVLVVDQVSKAWLLAFPSAEGQAQTFSFFGNSLSVVAMENLTFVFGVLADWPRSAQTGFLFLSALLFFAVALVFFRSLGPGESANAVALGLLMGGCVGNLADWGIRGAFIEIAHFRGFHASASWNFNVADACIGAGIALLLVELLVVEGASRAGGYPVTGADG